jgi:hypothetical protein
LCEDLLFGKLCIIFASKRGGMKNAGIENNVTNPLKLGISILLILLLGYGCNCHLQQEQRFLEKYGNEDFSDYKGVTLFYRGIDEDGRKKVAGFVPIQQGTCNSCFINAFVSNNSDCKLLYDTILFGEVLDTAFVQNKLTRFLEFEISELRVDTCGNVAIAFNEDYLELYMFVDENEVQRRSKEIKWKKVVGNWYKPKD